MVINELCYKEYMVNKNVFVEVQSMNQKIDKNEYYYLHDIENESSETLEDIIYSWVER